MRRRLGPAILISEDEVLIRIDAADIIGEAGFRTYEAGSSNEAFKLMERHADIFALFTDVGMLGTMNGLGLARSVRSRWPTIRIIIASGACEVTSPKGKRVTDMSDGKTAAPARVQEKAALMSALGWCAVAGCVIFAVTILIADFAVPDHDWMADTISDLGAGRYEFIVDIGIYAFSASLVSIALLAAHVHLGDGGWSFGVVGFALFGLIVFLVGARNEYGDNDAEGVVIHVYLVYVIGALMAALPWAMADGAGRTGRAYRPALIGISILWTLSSPVFFFLPDGYDGIYERYLGLLAGGTVITMASVFIRRSRRLQREC